MTEDSIREALKSVRYPGFSRDIVSFGIVRGVTVDPATQGSCCSACHCHQRPEHPRQDQGRRDRRPRRAARSGKGRHPNRDSKSAGGGRRGGQRRRTKQNSRHPLHHRRRQRQGRRRQVHRRRQPRGRARQAWVPRRPLRLRHVRTQRLHHVRQPRIGCLDRGRAHRAQRGARREIDVDGIPPRRRRFPGHPAWTDGHAAHPAIPPAGRLGRARFPHSRFAAGHRRHPAHHRADRRADRAPSS